jgi:MYXO-CTERM domain-containing protein
MHWSPRVIIALCALPLFVAQVAQAEDRPLISDHGETVRLPPIPGLDIQSDHVSKILYLNRCANGCTITPGDSDARTNTSSILFNTSQISPWANGDNSWEVLVDCVKELYAPYDVQVTDVDPGTNIFHHEAIVAGYPEEIGRDGIGGIAPSQCMPANNVISFTFSGVYGNNPISICHTVGQETAHSYGLEHAMDCSDPMTYLPTCGRQFFRDATTPCGEYANLDNCMCGGTAQNSHRWLRTVLGESAEMIAGPVVTYQTPSTDTVQTGFKVAVTATHIRGIGVVELFLNGTSYGEQEAHPRQSADSAYWFDTPADLADGVIDIDIRATNDIGTETIERRTVQKGAPCTSEASCNSGQSCEEGRCKYPPADGVLGDSCLTGATCASGICPMQGDQGYCSQGCFPTTTENTCPDGFECLGLSASDGVCWPKADSGGCGCQSGRQAGPLGAFFFLLFAGIGLRRRRSKLL